MNRADDAQQLPVRRFVDDYRHRHRGPRATGCDAAATPDRWFVESLFFRGRPGRLLLVATLIVAGATVLLPYTQLGPLSGFVPLPLVFVLMLLGITASDLVAGRLVKGWFSRRFT
jgi:hypothetical protein